MLWKYHEIVVFLKYNKKLYFLKYFYTGLSVCTTACMIWYDFLIWLKHDDLLFQKFNELECRISNFESTYVVLGNIKCVGPFFQMPKNPCTKWRNWFNSSSLQLNPNWHELWKQEKCSSLAPPRGAFLSDSMSLSGCQINPIDVNFTSK